MTIQNIFDVVITTNDMKPIQISPKWQTMPNTPSALLSGAQTDFASVVLSTPYLTMTDCEAHSNGCRSADHLGPLLLTWINFNPIMDK